jgi:DNA-binding transcriptional regulator YdaS (Cro superfamily)
VTGYIYAMRAEDIVKIGWSKKPEQRLSKVNSDSPVFVTLVGFVPGTLEQEQALHDLLSPWRMTNEWYRAWGAVAEFIAMLPPLPGKRKVDGIETVKGTMKLAAYMDAVGAKEETIAEKIGASQSYVNRLKNGHVWPSAEMARRIMEATDGKVTPNDFLPVDGAEKDHAA